jgi:hypothetical protein
MYALSDMTEKNDEQPEPKQKKEGQLLGCFFALGGVGLIFFLLILFLRSCAG